MRQAITRRDIGNTDHERPAQRCAEIGFAHEASLREAVGDSKSTQMLATAKAGLVNTVEDHDGLQEYAQARTAISTSNPTQLSPQTTLNPKP